MTLLLQYQALASANPYPVLGVEYKSLIQSCWVEAVAYNYPYPEATVALLSHSRLQR